jgi:hypothetical protein
VYERAYYEITKKTIDNLTGDPLELIIDATNIINKGDIDSIGYGSSCRKKKFTALTIVSTGTVPIEVYENKVNEKTIQFENSDKIHKITTLEHDTKGILPVMEKIKAKTNKKITLSGDKGYICNGEIIEKLKVLNTQLVTPYRQNQNKQNTEEEKKILKKRFRVENAICKLKRFNRIHIRRDKYMVNFMGFIYLGFLATL